MIIKKRWAWLMSIVLLGFLARADGHEDTDSLTVEEPFVMVNIKKTPFEGSIFDDAEEFIKVEDPSKKSIYTEEEFMDFSETVDLEKDTESLPKQDGLVEVHRFPYAIDSPPTVVSVSAMLSYCVYDESLSMKECKKFWKQNCDQDAFHQFKLSGTMNVMTVCKNEERVYVAFAGTQSLTDSMVDASVLSRTMNASKKGMYGHGGFVGRARHYASWLRKTLSGIKGIDQREVILTGHSLGAAVATLLAQDVYEGLELGVRGGVSNSLNQVKVIAFGSPSALLNPNNYFLGHLNHLRFSNPYDPIATTLSWWSGYGHVGVHLAIPDGPSRHIVRAAPLLSKQRSLKLLSDLPNSYWSSLPPLVRSRFDTGFDAHVMHSYAILADTAFADYQKQRQIRQSTTAITNVERVIGKRIGKPTKCELESGKVVCSSGDKVVAKFRYALDTPPTDYKANECMSSVMSNNFVPGVTANAGISVGDKMSPASVASEALVLDISEDDKWYGQMSSKTFASLYLDGLSPLPTMCEHKPALLEPAKTLPTERALIRKFMNAPNMFKTVKSNSKMITNGAVDLIQADGDFFRDISQYAWMDCRLPENSSFCPATCMGNQSCAVMKYWGADDKGIDYWVSLSRDPNLKWIGGCDNWRYTITEKKSGSWIPYWSSQNQATFMVVKNDYDEPFQFSN